MGSIHIRREQGNGGLRLRLDIKQELAPGEATLATFRLNHGVPAVQLRLLYGSDALQAYSDNSLLNLLSKGIDAGGVQTQSKAHLARHVTGYLQESLGSVLLDVRKTCC